MTFRNIKEQLNNVIVKIKDSLLGKRETPGWSIYTLANLVGIVDQINPNVFSGERKESFERCSGALHDKMIEHDWIAAFAYASALAVMYEKQTGKQFLGPFLKAEALKDATLSPEERRAEAKGMLSAARGKTEKLEVQTIEPSASPPLSKTEMDKQNAWRTRLDKEMTPVIGKIFIDVFEKDGEIAAEDGHRVLTFAQEAFISDEGEIITGDAIIMGSLLKFMSAAESHNRGGALGAMNELKCIMASMDKTEKKK
jgi:hypothetical protein